jgi:tetratricopeptide (TPR) repeat protein
VEWLGAGVAFDLEKRLERWPALQNSDRLQVRRALKDVDWSNDQAVARTLFDRLGADVVITLTGKMSNERLQLRAQLWIHSSTPAQTVELQGASADLLSLHGQLADQVVKALREAIPQLQAPENLDRLHVAPAKSIRAYEFMIRGMTAVQSGNSSAARENLNKALELEHDLWWARYFLGAAEFHEGNFSKAIEQCQAAIRLYPDLYAGVYANLAYCYEGAGDLDHFQWAKNEFERRTGKRLPQRALPSMGFAGRHSGEWRSRGVPGALPSS